LIDEKKRKETLEILQKELIQAKELYERGQFNKAFNIANRVYQESQALRDNVQIFDALVIISEIPIQLGNLEKIPELITQGENLLQTLIGESLEEIEQKKADLLRIKGLYYFNKGELGKGIEFQKQVLKIQKKLGNKEQIAKTLSYIGDGLALKGEVNESLNYYKKSLIICEDFDLKATKARNLMALSAICYIYGKIERALYYLNKSLKIAEEINHKPVIATVLNNLGCLYRVMGDLDRAMEVWERCLAIIEELNFTYMRVSVLDFIIQGAIEKNDHEQAQKHLLILEGINNQEKNKFYNLIYRLNKALVLKMSLRARDRADAEDLLKEIINEEVIIMEPKIIAILNLCNLLLKELQITGYMEIVDELRQYISQLLYISEQLHSYLFMAETYLLQAKLSLLTLNLKESKRFFTQARQIAKKWGLTQLSMKIENEQEDFLKQINKWEKLKEENATLSERLELAQIDEQIERMLQNRSQLIGQIIEDKVAVHKEKKICMICKGEVLGYIYICECNAIYCENCVQALIDLENACWVCESPIDQSKPVKLFKKEEMEIEEKTSAEKIKNSYKNKLIKK